MSASAPGAFTAIGFVERTATSASLEISAPGASYALGAANLAAGAAIVEASAPAALALGAQVLQVEAASIGFSAPAAALQPGALQAIASAALVSVSAPDSVLALVTSASAQAAIVAISSPDVISAPGSFASSALAAVVSVSAPEMVLEGGDIFEEPEPEIETMRLRRKHRRGAQTFQIQELETLFGYGGAIEYQALLSTIDLTTTFGSSLDPEIAGSITQSLAAGGAMSSHASAMRRSIEDRRQEIPIELSCEIGGDDELVKLSNAIDDADMRDLEELYLLGML